MGKITEITFGEKINGIEYKERIGAYGIYFNEENKILIIKTPTGYFLPGGGVEENKDFKQCLKREFIEETGLQIEIGEFIGKGSKHHYSDTLKCYLYNVGYFYVINSIEKVTCSSEHEHDSIYLTKKEAIDKLFLDHQKWAVGKA